MISLKDIESAFDIIRPMMGATAQYRWPLLCKALGCDVWVKHENHTPTGAFKVRGGLTYLHELSRSPTRPQALITATRGNHGQSIPYAAALYGIPITVLVPEGNSVDKNAAMAGWGATVETFGKDFDEARVETEARASASADLDLVPSFHPQLVSGVATYALELFRGVPDLDTVYVPIGMGSGVCGLIATRDALGLATKIVSVVSAHADAVAQSVEAGRIVETNSAATFADGMACRVPHPDAIEMIRRGAERIVRVTDDEVANAVRLLYRATHNVAEGAGAAACAAVAQEHERMAGKKVAIVLSGGNIDSEWLAEILSGGTPQVGD
jgi:threonine dehydratase